MEALLEFAFFLLWMCGVLAGLTMFAMVGEFFLLVNMFGFGGLVVFAERSKFLVAEAQEYDLLEERGAIKGTFMDFVLFQILSAWFRKQSWVVSRYEDLEQLVVEERAKRRNKE